MHITDGNFLLSAASLFGGKDTLLWLSIIVVSFGLLGGLFLLYKYFSHGRNKRPILYFSIAMIGLYLFAIPTIVENAGISIVLTKFNAFFALAFPLNFYARLLIGSAIFILANPALYKKWRHYLFVWAFVAAAYYVYIFWGSGQISSHWPIVFSISIFYLPVHVLTLALLLYWLRKDRQTMGVKALIGIFMLSAGVAIAVWRSFLVIQALLAYPPYFWFLAYSSGPLFATEIAYALLLLVGFHLIHKRYLDGPEAV
ncbi:MAG TPA: hypothetical protein VJG48_01225 [Candidatus Paceibacterota bacterium]